ncbi:unnamed protein product [Dibothriocephalus latus]|uniref:Uncharacterized protein n=1 Tax=Dibothriocephalus latus TaxID=60516 RepID=A0A3P6P4R2_DIBLA|nr:unnamed protein product [Dibothriocephalus latus]
MWSNKLYENLQQLREFTGADQLQKMYQNPTFQIQEVTDAFSQQLLNEALEKVVSNLKRKEKILQHLRESVEEEHVSYVPSDTEECYIRSKAISLLPPVPVENDTRPILCNESQYLPLTSDPLFHDLYVSVNTSAAHVPTNVYDL